MQTHILPLEAKKEFSEDKVDEYIMGLPPSTSRDNITFLLRLTWSLIGNELACFFRDEFSKLDDINLSEVLGDYITNDDDNQEAINQFKMIIKQKSERYLSLSYLFFKYGQKIRDEALRLGLGFPFNKPSDMVKVVALEESLNQLFINTQASYIFPSKKHLREYQSELRKIMKGKQENIPQATQERFKKQLEKPKNPVMPQLWSDFFYYCLRKFDPNALKELDRPTVEDKYLSKNYTSQMLIINGEMVKRS